MQKINEFAYPVQKIKKNCIHNDSGAINVLGARPSTA